MDSAKCLYLNSLVVFLLGSLACFAQPAYAQEKKSTPTSESAAVRFYPEPPDLPRLQFLTSISASTDLGLPTDRPKKNFLEKFLFGKEEQKKEWIAKPYGVAIDEHKLYVCDVQKKMVEILDLKKNTFAYLTLERRMTNPVNIFVEAGIKYIADPTAGRIFVFNRDNSLRRILGTNLGLKPIDVVVHDRRCYLTDMNGNQVVVLDINTGEVVLRMGKAGDALGQFVLIGDLALDAEENVYVTDKLLGRVTIFNRDGVYQRSFGKADKSIHGFVRPKGISVDEEGRIWVVDAAPEVTKIYTSTGELMLYFGFPGTRPGAMNMPASICIDDQHIERFREYITPNAEIDFLVFVTNQYGQKINVYGFGRFPDQERAIHKQIGTASEVATKTTQTRAKDLSEPTSPTPPTKEKQSPTDDAQLQARMQQIANLYYRSMQQYRNGQWIPARKGLLEVLESGLIPPPMIASVQQVIADIEVQLQAESEKPASP